LRKLRQAIDATGYVGPIEVEIFNDEIWKTADDGLLELIQRRFIEHVYVSIIARDRQWQNAIVAARRSAASSRAAGS
jgi:hypothetical protein